MKKLIHISLAIIILASCSAEKKMMRRQNRAADHIDKAIRLDPNILKDRTELIPISIKTPKIESQIRRNLAIPMVHELPATASMWIPANPSPKDTSTAIVFPVEFEDDSIHAWISLDGSQIVLDYKIKQMQIDTVIKDSDKYLEPTRNVPIPHKPNFFERIQNKIGELIIWALLIALIIILIKFLRK